MLYQLKESGQKVRITGYPEKKDVVNNNVAMF